MPVPLRLFSAGPVIAALAIIAAACGSGSEAEEGSGSAETGAPTSAEVGSVDAPPAISPGGVATGRVEIDGLEVDYVTATPEGFEAGDSAPLLLAFPPGGQDLGLTQSLVERTYAPEATRLGWVVVSPAAPDGKLFFRGGETIMPGFVDWIESWIQPDGGAPHVAGISNGGLSSFRYAAENPDRVRSVVAFPGFASTEGDLTAMADYADIPVRIFVGGEDTSWIGPAEDTVEAFERLGGDIELQIFPDEGHIMSSTADGSLLFDLLESFR